MQESGRHGSPDAGAVSALWPVIVVWGLAAAVVVATFVTYTRIDPQELYHVSRSGLAGGARRALVVLNFPVAVLALAMLPVLVARLLIGPVSRVRWWTVVAVSAVAAALSLVTAWPGVVNQADLDAKPINALPAIGVALTLGLTVAALRTPAARIATETRPRFETRIRFALLALVAVVSLPWLFAEAGFYVSTVPGLGRVFVSDEFLPAGATLPAVHFGHHHGLDGAIFAVSALVLMPATVAIGGRALRHTGLALVALMFVYGAMNLMQDFWGEQVVKRGWSDSHFPEVLRPEVTPAWGLIVVLSALLYLYLAGTWRASHGRDFPQHPAPSTLH